MPSTTTIEALTSVWRRVLQRESVGAEDNFFDLGGDPASANRLFRQITQEFGRELSPLTIYQAPTIVELAAVLEDPALPRFRALVLLKAGPDGPPVFLVPGLGGSVMEFFQLVKHIESRHPIYGMQSRGMDGVEEPFDRIEDLAQFYLDAIRGLQPRGPYILVGYSLGGLVALEMAQRLTQDGEKIALLVMVESYPHRTHVPLWQHAGIIRRRAARSLFQMLRRTGLASHDSEESGATMLDIPRAGEKWTNVLKHARSVGYLSWQRYVPRHYKGRVNFIKCAEREPKHPYDPIATWAGLINEIVVDTVPGSHLGIVAIHFKSLAAALSRCLKPIRCSE